MTGQWWLFPDHGAVYADDVVSDDAKEHARAVMVIDPGEPADKNAVDLEQLLADHAAMTRVRDLARQWHERMTYGVWNERREYQSRLAQLDRALAGPPEGTQP